MQALTIFEGVSSSHSGCLLCLYMIMTYCRSNQNGEVSMKTVSDTNKQIFSWVKTFTVHFQGKPKVNGLS